MPAEMHRILISAALLVEERMTGLERFSLDLLRALRSTCPPHRELIIAGPRWLNDHFDGVVESPPAHWPRPLVNELWLAALLRRHRPDALHTLVYAPPVLSRSPWIGTVHDLVPWQRRETLGTAGKWYLGPTTRRAVRRRRPLLLITPAETTATALREITESPVVTIPEGVSSAFTPRPKAPPSGDCRLLSVGTIEPRKDLATLAKATDILRARGRQVDARVVGRRGWGEGPPAQLRELGYLSEDSLIGEYYNAQLLVAASTMEGFDLPVLEAMACGLPVVASDIPVHRELFGSAARLFPVGDADALAAAVEWLLDHPQEREAQREAGLRLAADYTWEAAARRVHGVYDDLAQTDDDG